MKKNVLLTFMTTLLLTVGCAATAQAEIIPAQNEGWQIGPPAVVLCDSLSMRQEKSLDSAAVQTLTYGSRVSVLNQADGWAECVFGDAENSPSGWVNASFLAINPSYYRTTEDTTVYAWNDQAALKVAVLDANTTLPILKEEGEWLIVSLRGATGWIYNPAKTTTESTATASTETKESSAESTSGSSSESQSSSFTVYAKDGSTASIHFVAGATYEDGSGRTYIKQDSDAFYYCVSTDTTYAADPTQWTGEYYGENQYADEEELTGEYYGENQYVDEYGLTGADYGEGEL